MNETFNEALCDERHSTLDKWCNKLEAGVGENKKAINGQKNWIIGVLVVVVLNLIVLLAK